MTAGVGKIIPCLTCGGTGFTVQASMDGTRRPVTCKGCNGSGHQTVRAQ